MTASLSQDAPFRFPHTSRQSARSGFKAVGGYAPRHRPCPWIAWRIVRTSGSARNDALSREGGIGWIPKVDSTFGSDALACFYVTGDPPMRHGWRLFLFAAFSWLTAPALAQGMTTLRVGHFPNITHVQAL